MPKLSNKIRPSVLPLWGLQPQSRNSETLDFPLRCRLTTEPPIKTPQDASTALISVYGTTGFWNRFQFRETPLTDPAKLLPYGEDAVFMVRRRELRRD